MQETLFTAPPQDSSLVPLDERDILDPVGEEVQRIKRTETQIWKLVSLFEALLLLLILPATAFLAYRVSQPVVRWMRINTMGQVEAIQYNDLNYTPEAVEVRQHLSDWATYSYARQQQTVLATYRRRFYFMTSALVAMTRQKDDKDQVIAQIAVGRIPGNKITDLTISFTSFETHGSKAKGTAEIYFSKVLESPSPSKPSQHFQTSVTFEVDPSRVPSITANLLPEYQEVNPIGLLITFLDERMIP